MQKDTQKNNKEHIENKINDAPQKPLMLAYIIFLVFSLLYHIISTLFNISFEAWESIIVAATIASYFFTLASGEAYFIKLHKIHIKHLKEYDNILEKIEKELPEIKKQNGLISIVQEKEETKKQISLKTKNIQKAQNTFFHFQVIGYLMFFCILTIDWFFNFFKSSQDIYTLLAFILLMFMEYLETTRLKCFENTFNEIINMKNEFFSLITINKN